MGESLNLIKSLLSEITIREEFRRERELIKDKSLEEYKINTEKKVETALVASTAAIEKAEILNEKSSSELKKMISDVMLSVKEIEKNQSKGIGREERGVKDGSQYNWNITTIISALALVGLIIDIIVHLKS